MRAILLVFLLIPVFDFPSTIAEATPPSAWAPVVTASVTGTSAQVLAANLNRKYLIIVNNGSATVYIKTDTAHSGTEGIALLAGQSYEPATPPINSIWMVSASGTQSCSIIEGN